MLLLRGMNLLYALHNMGLFCYLNTVAHSKETSLRGFSRIFEKRIQFSCLQS